MLEYYSYPHNIVPSDFIVRKVELKRYKCNIVEILGKQNLVKIRLINHPFEVFYNLPLHFFNEIGLGMEKFYLVCFDDYSIVLEKIII